MDKAKKKHSKKKKKKSQSLACFLILAKYYNWAPDWKEVSETVRALWQ